MPDAHSAPDLLYSDDEEELRTAVRRLLADHCTAADVLARTESDTPHDSVLWRLLATDMGLAGLLVPERLGGQGATHREAAVVLEELGRSLAPVPYLTSAVMATEALLGCLADTADEVAANAAAGSDPAGDASGASAAGGGPESDGPTSGGPTSGGPRGGAVGDGLGAEPVGEGPAIELLTDLSTGRSIAVLALPLATGPETVGGGERGPATAKSTSASGSGTDANTGPTVRNARPDAEASADADAGARPVAGAHGAVRHEHGALHGRITHVADAAAADVLLVAADTGLYAVDTRQDGVSITPRTTLDRTRPLADVTLAAARARALAADARPAVRRALDAGAGLLASEQLGVADWCLTETVRYTRERHQFNRPVGSFQALKHRLAHLWLRLVHTRAAARNAADALATGSPETALAVALAQSSASDTAVHAAEEALQLHGGIGMTWEHPVHLYLKRAKADSLALGTAAQHRQRLATLADLAPPRG